MREPAVADRHRWRAAVRIEQHVRRRLPRWPEFSADIGWDRFQQAHARLQTVLARGWRSAARQQQSAVNRSAGALRQHVERYQQSVEACLRPFAEPSVREIHAELQALEQEFDRMELNLRERTVTVETDPIVLEGIRLGPFAIQLAWERIGCARPYEVIALAPSPAASDSSTVHPHVRDRGLCEGEGGSAIQEALVAGRVLDFFLIVRQILETYNPDNAYIALEHWFGRTCTDCGNVASSDDATECERCEGLLCWDCSCSCADCHETCCGDCRERCPACDALLCSGCAANCEQCDSLSCAQCLTERLCDDCAPDPEPPTEEPPDADLREPAAVAPPQEPAQLPSSVHAHGAGDAAPEVVPTGPVPLAIPRRSRRRHNLAVRHRWRVAQRIEQLVHTNLFNPLPHSFADEAWQRLAAALTRLDRLVHLGWHVAARDVVRDVDAAWTALFAERDGYRRDVDRILQPQPHAGVREIYDDLRSLEQEFDVVTIEMRSRTISVETAPIVLEGIDLGPFEIRLDWERLSQGYPYEVLAKAPRPAASDASTPHPHVRNTALCEGAGESAIGQTLAEGRVFEFFLLVRQVLQTYNAENAYIELDRWFRRECRDCGGLTTDDDSRRCERCRTDVCDDCLTICRECARVCCGDCQERCPACEAGVCLRCASNCDRCNAPRCLACLTDGLCADCQALPPTETADATTLGAPTPTGPTVCRSPPAAEGPHPAAVHAVCLGQAAVLA